MDGNKVSIQHFTNNSSSCYLKCSAVNRYNIIHYFLYFCTTLSVYLNQSLLFLWPSNRNKQTWIERILLNYNYNLQHRAVLVWNTVHYSGTISKSKQLCFVCMFNDLATSLLKRFTSVWYNQDRIESTKNTNSTLMRSYVVYSVHYIVSLQCKKNLHFVVTVWRWWLT